MALSERNKNKEEQTSIQLQPLVMCFLLFFKLYFKLLEIKGINLCIDLAFNPELIPQQIYKA